MNYQDTICFGQRNCAAKTYPRDPVIVLSDEERIALPYTVTEDGKTILRLYYPAASTVEVFTMSGTLPLKREGDYWTLKADMGRGFQALIVLVDGNQVLNPLLPIGFGDGRPINFLDIPDGCDLREIKDVPHGVVCADYLKNPVTGQEERIQMYLPPQYFTERERRFPVLYLQHGIGENETVWVNQGRINFVLDNLIAEHKIAPMVVVMCNGMMTQWRENESHVCYASFPEFLKGAVLPHIEGRYRVYMDCGHRVMAGLSMGSIQTSRTALKYPELFRAIGLFSGFFSDPLSPSDHITPDSLAALRKSSPLFFRAMGNDDPFMPFFQGDDKLLEENGIPNIRKMYPGQHEWNVWRQCFVDFVQLVFKEEEK